MTALDMLRFALAAAEPLQAANGRMSVEIRGQSRQRRARELQPVLAAVGVTDVHIKKISDRAIWVNIRMPVQAHLFSRVLQVIRRHSEMQNPPMDLYTGRGAYDLRKLPENAKLIWNAFQATANEKSAHAAAEPVSDRPNAISLLREALAAAEPQAHRDITWADVIAAVPTSEQHLQQARVRGTVRFPVVYSYGNRPEAQHRGIVVIGRNCHAVLTDNNVGVRAEFRRGPWNQGVGAELPKFGRPAVFLFTDYTTVRDLLRAVLTEFRRRGGELSKAQAAAEPEAPRDFAQAWVDLVSWFPPYGRRKRAGSGSDAVTLYVDSRMPSSPWAERGVLESGRAHAFLVLPAEIADAVRQQLDYGVATRRLRTTPKAQLTFYPGPRPRDNEVYRTLRPTHIQLYDLQGFRDTRSALQEILRDFLGLQSRNS